MNAGMLWGRGRVEGVEGGYWFVVIVATVVGGEVGNEQV